MNPPEIKNKNVGKPFYQETKLASIYAELKWIMIVRYLY